MSEITINEGLLKDTADAIVMYVLFEDMEYRGLETRVSNAFIHELKEYVERRLKDLISYARVLEGPKTKGECRMNYDENANAAKVIKGMMERRGQYGADDEIYNALALAAYVLLNPDCQTCDYFEYDCFYDPEVGGDEYDVSYCTRKTRQGNKSTYIKWIPRGKWIVHKRDDIEYLECDQCGVFFLHHHLTRNSYCPNCGSDMRAE